jgi:hypothetical protein
MAEIDLVFSPLIDREFSSQNVIQGERKTFLKVSSRSYVFQYSWESVHTTSKLLSPNVQCRQGLFRPRSGETVPRLSKVDREDGVFGLLQASHANTPKILSGSAGPSPFFIVIEKSHSRFPAGTHRSSTTVWFQTRSPNRRRRESLRGTQATGGQNIQSMSIRISNRNQCFELVSKPHSERYPGY